MPDLNTTLETIKAERKTLFMLARNAADNAELAVLSPRGKIYNVSEYDWGLLARIYSYSVTRLDRAIEFAELPKDTRSAK